MTCTQTYALFKTESVQAKILILNNSSERGQIFCPSPTKYGRFRDFFLESFNLWCLLLMITLYHQIETSISFWCERELNSKSLIQPLESLPVKLIETHMF